MNKKHKILIFIFISLIIIFSIIYKLAFYTPPLLDSGNRNAFEKTTDFLCFGWHFTKASIYHDYFKNKDKAKKELGKAGWYRIKFLTKYFSVKEKDIASISNIYKSLKINSISKKLDAFLIREQEK